MKEVVRENEAQSGSLFGVKQCDSFLLKETINIEKNSAFLGSVEGHYVDVKDPFGSQSQHDLIYEQ